MSKDNFIANTYNNKNFAKHYQLSLVFSTTFFRFKITGIYTNLNIFNKK